MAARLGSALLVALLALPASAMAATTIGSSLTSAPGVTTGTCLTANPCTTMLQKIGGVDQAAPINGVVVSWAVRATAADDGVQLRIMHPTDTTPHYSPTTTSAAVNLTGTHAVERFATRLPITKGDYLAVRGADIQVVPIFPATSPASSVNRGFNDPFADGAAGRTPDSTGTAETLLQATIEPDADGDGYGDETQDQCPHDAQDHVPPCGATTVGPSVLPIASSGTGCGIAPATCLWVDPAYPVPATGVVVRYRVQTTSTACCFAVRPASIAAAGIVGGAPSPDAAPSALGVATFDDVHIPVTAGGYVGLRQVSPAGVGEYDSTGSYDALNPDPATGIGAPFTSVANTIAFNADVEPDADHDGFGDSTQDLCASDPTSHDRACAADLSLSVSPAPAVLTALGALATTAVTLTNAGPADAANATVTLAAPHGAQLMNASSSVGSCTVTTVTCALGTIHPGGAATVSVGVTASAAGAVVLSAHAAGTTPDPDPSNNDAAPSVSFFSVVQPPPAPPKPCSVIKRGTGDTDTLSGTSFGDKISGLGDRDLIHGRDGDDCLYGGLGDDVLFGDAGNDKLYGQDGNDRLLGGNGNDTLSGGNGKDRLSGEAGNDVLIGSAGSDSLSGGSGNDRINAGTGRDRVDGGPGNDTINAYDHTRDAIDCGPGSDTANVDRKDHVTHCEHVHRH